MSQGLDTFVEFLSLGLLGKLSLAVLLGGAIGLEREVRSKAAGLRTNILICMGAVLFTDLSVTVSGDQGDPARIAAQVVTGVGFLGAGTILRSRGNITGLTSAATIWLVAAIGVAIGAGATLEAAGTTLLVVGVLSVLGTLERRVRGMATVSHIAVEVEAGPDSEKEIMEIIRGAGLEVVSISSREHEGRAMIEVLAKGPARRQDEAKLRLLKASGSVQVSVEE